MHNSGQPVSILLAVLLALFSAAGLFAEEPAVSEFSVHPLLTDHAVLQRGIPAVVRGRDIPGQTVTLRMNGSEVQTIASDNGLWSSELPGPSQGGPFTISIEGSESVLFRDVVFGDVYLCSGQSNMNWPLWNTENGEQEALRANDSSIRLFTVAKRPAITPRFAPDSRWELMTPQSAREFSAMSYYFAKRLRAEGVGVPIGLIHSSWNGTAIRSWMSPGAMNSANEQDWINQAEAIRKSISEPHALAMDRMDEYYAEMENVWSEAELRDGENEGAAAGWQQPDFDDSHWLRMDLPGSFENAGWRVDGAFWLRRSFDLPEGMTSEGVVFALGAIDDFDITYLNGKEIGGTGRDTPRWWQHPRRYPAPPGLLLPKKNIIAIRVFDQIYGGGLLGPAIQVEDSEGSVLADLSGEWRIAPERGRFAKPPPAGNPPYAFDQHTPAALHHGMISPLGYPALSGILWYQGSSDARTPEDYQRWLTALIKDWRVRFQNPDALFLIGMLSPYGNDNWPGHEFARLRESQRQVAAAMHRVEIANFNETGVRDDIHPRDKKTPGDRMALLALRYLYGRNDLVCHAPEVKSAARSADGWEVTFALGTAETALRCAADPVEGFEIRDANGEWRAVQATITASGAVTLQERGEITAVRYAWRDFPEIEYLMNTEGIPANPFKLEIGG